MEFYSGQDLIRDKFPELLHDESRYTLGCPTMVFLPKNTKEIQFVLKDASTHSTPVTIISGQTGITGGSVPTDQCYALSLSRMDKILSVSKNKTDTFILHCEPGVSLASISQFLKDPKAWPYTVAGSEYILGKNLLYPPDPTEMTAHLGGTVANNASGARSFYFGPTRKHLEELSLVFANGDTKTLIRGSHICTFDNCQITTDQGTTFTIHRPTYHFPTIKNASGYFSSPVELDIIDLFIGSEGTLAAISQIGIRLIQKPLFIGGLSFFPNRKSAFTAASFFRKQDSISALEYFDENALGILSSMQQSMSHDFPAIPIGKTCALYWEYIETPDAPLEDNMDLWEKSLNDQGFSFEDTWSGFEEKEMATLKSFRHAIPEAINTLIAQYKKECPEIRKISTDASLPSAVFESTIDNWISLIKKTGLQYAMFGHLGDYHLHINLIPHNKAELLAAQELYKTMMSHVVNVQGVVSAEHGIGKLKPAYLALMYGEVAIEEMKRIKRDLDPLWLLNPGTMFSL